MTEFFQFATSGFWVFLGCCILIGIAVRGLIAIVAILRVGSWPPAGKD